VAPLVRQKGRRLAEGLAEVYRTEWPAARIRVDVAHDAGSAGAYTTLDPLRVTISSNNPDIQGRGAFEVLFHEASRALAGEVNEAIARECAAWANPSRGNSGTRCCSTPPAKWCAAPWWRHRESPVARLPW